MIDLKVRTIGATEVAERFTRKESDLRGQLQQELDDIGQEIVLAARSTVPRRSGLTMSRIIYRHGRETRRGFQNAGDDKLMLTVLPGEPTAHLIERGVNATVTKGRRSRGGDVFAVKGKRQSRKLVAMGVKFGKSYQLIIPAHPYFIPAVESVGGASGVNQRLQATIDRVAGTP